MASISCSVTSRVFLRGITASDGVANCIADGVETLSIPSLIRTHWTRSWTLSDVESEYDVDIPSYA